MALRQSFPRTISSFATANCVTPSMINTVLLHWRCIQSNLLISRGEQEPYHSMFRTIPKDLTLRGQNSGSQTRQFPLLSPTLFLVISVLYLDMVLEFACRLTRMPEMLGYVPMEETSTDGEQWNWSLSGIGFRKKFHTKIHAHNGSVASNLLRGPMVLLTTSNSASPKIKLSFGAPMPVVPLQD